MMFHVWTCSKCETAGNWWTHGWLVGCCAIKIKFVLPFCKWFFTSTSTCWKQQAAPLEGDYWIDCVVLMRQPLALWQHQTVFLIFSPMNDLLGSQMGRCEMMPYFCLLKNGHSWHCQFSSNNHPKSQDVNVFMSHPHIPAYPKCCCFFIYILHIRFTISRQKLKSHHLNGRHIPQRVQPQLASPTLNRRWTWATMGCTRNASKNRSRFWPHVSWWKYD